MSQFPIKGLIHRRLFCSQRRKVKLRRDVIIFTQSTVRINTGKANKSKKSPQRPETRREVLWKRTEMLLTTKNFIPFGGRSKSEENKSLGTELGASGLTRHRIQNWFEALIPDCALALSLVSPLLLSRTFSSFYIAPRARRPPSLTGGSTEGGAGGTPSDPLRPSHSREQNSPKSPSNFPFQISPKSSIELKFLYPCWCHFMIPLERNQNFWKRGVCLR